MVPGPSRAEATAWPGHVIAPGGGCCTKPRRKSGCALAAVGARAAGRDDIATEHLRATDEMAVFRAHP